MTTEVNERIKDLAQQYVWATGVKQAASLRIQCTLAEWNQVLAEAKRIVQQRGRTR